MNQKELNSISQAYSKYRASLITDYTTGNLIKSVENYFKENSLKHAFIGVSGGVDSAVALAILDRANIEVHPYHITFLDYRYVDSSPYINKLNLGRERPIKEIDISGIVDHHLNLLSQPVSLHTIEQTTYALRNQILFSMASQYPDAVTVGTTNKSELDYVGWFGVHSDMNVDIQFLWQYSKPQIYKLAKLLNVPKEIIERPAVGDLPNGSTDEENFGCTYDELTWYVENKIYLKSCEQNNMYNHPFTHQKFSQVNALHEKNKHKYETKGRTHFNPVFIETL